MNNLRDLLETKLSGASFVTINTTTTPKLNKTLVTDDGRIENPYFDKVTKQSKLNCQIFQNKVKNGYEEMVKRRMVKEGKDPETFELQPRKWGVRLPNLPIIEHKGEYYLEVIVHNTLSSEYIYNNKSVKSTEIKGWPSSGDPEKSQGGIEDKVEIRSIKLSNIKEIHIGGEVLTDLFFN